MQAVTLNAVPRTETGRKLAEVREKKLIPAIIYGKKHAPQMVSVDSKTFSKMVHGGGETMLVDMMVEGAKAPIKALIQDIQRDALTEAVLHVDFRAVSMDEKLKVRIPFEFVGESGAVKNLGGTLVKNMEEVEVLCLPTALVNHIEVDISPLVAFENKIRLHDIKLPEGMTQVGEGNEVIVLVAPPRTDEEMAELDKAVELDASKVEVVKKEKSEEEGEEGAVEGAAPAEAKKEEKKK